MRTLFLRMAFLNTFAIAIAIAAAATATNTITISSLFLALCVKMLIWTSAVVTADRLLLMLLTCRRISLGRVTEISGMLLLLIFCFLLCYHL